MVDVSQLNMQRPLVEADGRPTREFFRFLQQLRDRTGGSTDVIAGGVNTGDIKGFGGIEAPSGWLFCDGSAISRTTFPALFSVIGTQFGIGNGTTTFNLPDGEGRTLVGEGGSFSIGDEGGLEEVSLTETENGPHIHDIDDPGHQHGA